VTHGGGGTLEVGDRGNRLVGRLGHVGQKGSWAIWFCCKKEEKGGLQ
jgi:hypothetical protein